MMLACYRITSSYFSVVNMRRIRFLGTLRARRKSRLIFTFFLYFSGRLLVAVGASARLQRARPGVACRPRVCGVVPHPRGFHQRQRVGGSGEN